MHSLSKAIYRKAMTLSNGIRFDVKIIQSHFYSEFSLSFFSIQSDEDEDGQESNQRQASCHLNSNN